MSSALAWLRRKEVERLTAVNAELREALQAAIVHEDLHDNECRRSGIEHCWLNRARAAIDKAKGEAQS